MRRTTVSLACVTVLSLGYGDNTLGTGWPRPGRRPRGRTDRRSEVERIRERKSRCVPATGSYRHQGFGRTAGGAIDRRKALSHGPLRARTDPGPVRGRRAAQGSR